MTQSSHTGTQLRVLSNVQSRDAGNALSQGESCWLEAQPRNRILGATDAGRLRSRDAFVG